MPAVNRRISSKSNLAWVRVWHIRHTPQNVSVYILATKNYVATSHDWWRHTIGRNSIARWKDTPTHELWRSVAWCDLRVNAKTQQFTDRRGHNSNACTYTNKYQTSDTFNRRYVRCATNRRSDICAHPETIVTSVTQETQQTVIIKVPKVISTFLCNSIQCKLQTVFIAYYTKWVNTPK